ncbi:protein-tyrosine phosphatase family protein [Neisseria wadsworthii]|uniref:protein-tyrosine phosphatase family protein n=1 Tax=Neisseria wadsworthii TaxID=607711 RepID=UPI0002E4E558|nr:protein-tyrosine phosphatase family protein [Neisseria wadsworthii]
MCKVDARLYRSEQLVRDDIAQIERLGIQSIVNLRFFDRNDDRQLLGGRGFNLINSPLLTWHIKPKNIAEMLYLIEASQQSGPVSVHCYHGADRTGLIVGMYRIIYQGWPVEAAKQEMQQGSYGFIVFGKILISCLRKRK